MIEEWWRLPRWVFLVQACRWLMVQPRWILDSWVPNSDSLARFLDAEVGLVP